MMMIFYMMIIVIITYDLWVNVKVLFYTGHILKALYLSDIMEMTISFRLSENEWSRYMSGSVEFLKIHLTFFLNKIVAPCLCGHMDVIIYFSDQFVLYR